MFSRPPVRLIAATLVAAVVARAEEANAWPLFVRHDSPAPQTSSVQALGPLLFAKETPQKTVRGFRPLYLEVIEPDRETDFLLYPLFTWEKRGEARSFSFFNLVNHRHELSYQSKPVHAFDVWPFYFSRDTGDAATTYRALLPIHGTIKNRFGKDRIDFTAFPLYAHTQKNGMHIHHTPWPFIRTISGAGHTGFEFWPLFGRKSRDGDYRSQFYLWPLLYKRESKLAEPTPHVSLGFLPFYTRDTSPGYRNENYLWPFFGYSDRSAPYRYHETRYLWPFLVQARGDDRYINRWGPVYTHSVIKGYDKKWYLWPLVRHATWSADGVAQQKDQILFFVYWSLTQTSLANPSAAPAHKTHLWPLVSSWDNGAGQRQWQLFSPLEVFFPSNEPIRQLYSPLFALYRYDQQAVGHTRHSALWNLVSWKNTPEEKAFHLGPLVSVKTTTEQKRFALGRGLISLRRDPGQTRWRLRLFDFSASPASPAPAAATP